MCQLSALLINNEGERYIIPDIWFRKLFITVLLKVLLSAKISYDISPHLIFINCRLVVEEIAYSILLKSLDRVPVSSEKVAISNLSGKRSTVYSL
jgi:hypothetical protein